MSTVQNITRNRGDFLSKKTATVEKLRNKGGIVVYTVLKR